MSDLDAIAARHEVPADAVGHLLDALVFGHGRMAQFSHPALGGMGQWHAGGMIMIGDMFDTGLKARVSALCDDLLPLVAEHGTRPGAMPGRWWPEGLGQPSGTGSQNGARYAVFPAERRLVIESDGRTSVYDTADHVIAGVSQQQSEGRRLGFSSQHGTVRLEDLAEIGRDAIPAKPIPAKPIPARPDAPARQSASLPASAAAPEIEAPRPVPASAEPAQKGAPGEPDVLSLLERLAELQRKGVLTEAEFSAKKTELLARL